MPLVHSPNPQEITFNFRCCCGPFAAPPSCGMAPFGLRFLQPFTNSMKTSVGSDSRLPSLSTIVSCSSCWFVVDICGLAAGRLCRIACALGIAGGVVWCSVSLPVGRSSSTSLPKSCSVTGSVGWFSRYDWSSCRTETSICLSVGRLRLSLCFLNSQFSC